MQEDPAIMISAFPGTSASPPKAVRLGNHQSTGVASRNVDLRCGVLKLKSISKENGRFEVPLNICLFEWLNLAAELVLDLQTVVRLVSQTLGVVSKRSMGLGDVLTILYHLQRQQWAFCP